MNDEILKNDWLKIGLPNDLPTLRNMLACEELIGERGDDIKEPIRRKIARLEKRKK